MSRRLHTVTDVTLVQAAEDDNAAGATEALLTGAPSALVLHAREPAPGGDVVHASHGQTLAPSTRMR